MSLDNAREVNRLRQELHELQVICRSDQELLRRALALLRRFETCCGSGLDADVLDDLYDFLESVDAR